LDAGRNPYLTTVIRVGVTEVTLTAVISLSPFLAQATIASVQTLQQIALLEMFSQQEFTLRWSPDRGNSFQEIVRQQ
jgi:hypothetical protein